MPILILFVVVPLVELWVLIGIGGEIGLLNTIALIVVTGIVGATLARMQGLQTLRRFQEAAARGELPHREILDGLLILVAGAVLLTPGVLTDAFGFLLLLPPFRALIRGRLAAWARRNVHVAGDPNAFRGGPFGPPPGGPPGSGPRPGPPVDGEVIDVDYTVHERDSDRPSGG